MSLTRGTVDKAANYRIRIEGGQELLGPRVGSDLRDLNGDYSYPQSSRQPDKQDTYETKNSLPSLYLFRTSLMEFWNLLPSLSVGYKSC